MNINPIVRRVQTIVGQDGKAYDLTRISDSKLLNILGDTLVKGSTGLLEILIDEVCYRYNHHLVIHDPELLEKIEELEAIVKYNSKFIKQPTEEIKKSCFDTDEVTGFN